MSDHATIAIGAHYAECSAKVGTGVHELFQRALEGSLKSKSLSKIKRRVTCKIL